MSCHPQNSELACSTPRSHFLLSLVRLFHCSSPSRPSLDWSVKIWLKQTRDVMRCYEKKPLQATNDVLFKTRIFPLCQCLKILIWFFCSLADAALYNLEENIKNLEKWQSSIRVEWQNIEQLLNDFQTTQKRSNILRFRTFWLWLMCGLAIVCRALVNCNCNITTIFINTHQVGFGFFFVMMVMMDQSGFWIAA